jgi:hypothetical protein
MFCSDVQTEKSLQITINFNDTDTDCPWITFFYSNLFRSTDGSLFCKEDHTQDQVSILNTYFLHHWNMLECLAKTSFFRLV